MQCNGLVRAWKSPGDAGTARPAPTLSHTVSRRCLVSAGTLPWSLVWANFRARCVVGASAWPVYWQNFPHLGASRGGGGVP